MMVASTFTACLWIHPSLRLFSSCAVCQYLERVRTAFAGEPTALCHRVQWAESLLLPAVVGTERPNILLKEFYNMGLQRVRARR